MGGQESKLYVGNLSYQVDDEALNNFFESNEIPVQSVVIVKDKYTDRSKGFGFVEVSSQEEVDKAIEVMNGKELDGRAVTVNQARPREERNRFSGGPRGGGDRGGRDRKGGRSGGSGFGKPRNRY